MTTKVFDTFAGAAGTDLSAHTPDTDVVGGGWTDSNANNIELDGSGAVKFAAASRGSWIDTGTVDQWSIANFNAGGVDNRVSIYLRRDSAGHSTRTCYAFNYRPADSGAELKIYKIVSGSYTELVSGSFTNSSSTTYSFEAAVNGSSLDFIIDGVSELSTTDTSISTGSYAGITHDKFVNGDGRFYDFQIDDAAPGAPTGINIFRRRMIMRKAA